jgi:hypothetical protein
MRHPAPITGAVTPQPPGRTPHRFAPRLPGGEALPRGNPGPRASRTTILRASGTTKRAVVQRASGATSREGGNEMSSRDPLVVAVLGLGEAGPIPASIPSASSPPSPAPCPVRRYRCVTVRAVCIGRMA